ncbi:MAG: helix-turn-helix transcriptional regulator [Pseudomonadota bacterium]
MNFGEKLKQLRSEKNWTQPQLAEAIGIEQSYLSKLENDKSIPSADIFQAIIKAFAIDVESFLEGVDAQIIQRQLRQIPEVANFLNAGIAGKIHNIKKWLFCSAAACVIGLTLIVAGQMGLVFSNTLYNYESAGIILANEPQDIFENYGKLLNSKRSSGEIASREELEKQWYEFTSTRRRPNYLALPNYQGSIFNAAVEDGSRTYFLKDSRETNQPKNKFLILIGALLGFAGLFGFFVEFRLRRI